MALIAQAQFSDVLLAAVLYIHVQRVHLLSAQLTSLNSQNVICTQVTEKLSIPFEEVDTHNVIPVWVTSEKKEIGARTIRPKIHRKLPEYLTVSHD